MGSFPAARLEASLLGGGEFLGDHMMVFRENGGTSLTYYKGGLTWGGGDKFCSDTTKILQLPPQPPPPPLHSGDDSLSMQSPLSHVPFIRDYVQCPQTYLILRGPCNTQTIL